MAAIGSPFGNVNSLSVGVVSATERSIDSLTSQYSLIDAIQTDAAINHGNSGGPLFDARGRVIGINAQIRSDSGSAEGVGFAVPIDSAQRSMAQLIAARRVSYAYVGIETEDLIPTDREAAPLPGFARGGRDEGEPSAPGARAGLQAGTESRRCLARLHSRRRCDRRASPVTRRQRRRCCPRRHRAAVPAGPSQSPSSEEDAATA